MGAGAVGNYCAAKLTQAGHNVILFARGETLATIEKDGVRITHEGKTHSTRVPVRDVAEAPTTSELDIILLATKITGHNAVLPKLAPGIPVVTIQNSVETPYIAAEAYGEKNVLPGTIRGFWTKLGPGHLEFAGGPVVLRFGSFDGATTPLMEEFTAVMNESGVPAEILPNAWVDIWSKALFVTPFGALGAAAAQPLGYVRTTLRASYIDLLEEAISVALALGVPMPEDTVEQQLAFADSLNPDNTTSMQRDLMDGNASELDAQAGAILRMADKEGIPVPLFRMLVGILEARYGKDAKK